MNEPDSIFEGFKTYYMAAGTASITFSKNGIGISKAAVMKLENSPYAKIMFDYAKKRMAIIKCGEEDDGAVRFARQNKDGARWNSSDLCDTIKQITGWTVDERERYTVAGLFVEQEGQPALIFDLTQFSRA